MAAEPPAPAGAGPARPGPSKEDLILQRLDELIRATQYQALGPDRLVEFVTRDRFIRMHVPLFPGDYIQRHIVQTRGFYEARALNDIRPLIGPDSVVLDAGANIGNHTVYFAAVCGARHVHAVEPMRVAHGILRRNIALNGLEQAVTVHHVALGAEEGFADLLNYLERNIGGASVRYGREGAYPVRTIDSLGLEALHFVKMDVEGNHVSALRGARETLARHRPLIWIEMRENTGEIESGTALLKELGYRFERLVGRSPNDHLFVPD